MKRPALAPRQADVLGFIRRYIDEQGIAPTLREIGRAVGIGSTNGVNDHLRRLEQKGYIARGEALELRAIWLLDDEGRRETLGRLRAERDALRVEVERLRGEIGALRGEARP